jgi:hypothetical protein
MYVCVYLRLGHLFPCTIRFLIYSAQNCHGSDVITVMEETLGVVLHVEDNYRSRSEEDDFPRVDHFTVGQGKPLHAEMRQMCV